MKDIKQRQRAFTLVELLIVVIIVGLLFILCVAQINFSTDSARESGAQADFRAYQIACNTIGLQHAGFTDDLDELVLLLNEKLDEELYLYVENGNLVIKQQDPWGMEYKVEYAKPHNTNGQLVFRSAGKDKEYNTKDDITTSIRYDTSLPRGEIVIENTGAGADAVPGEDVGGGEHGGSHTHDFSKKVINTYYRKSVANCTSKAIYYYSCECGERGTSTFEDSEIDPSNHAGPITASYTSLSSSQHVYKRICDSCSNTITTYTEKHRVDGTSCMDCGHNFGPAHTHSYDKQVATEQYCKSEATCASKAIYYYSCECGEKGSTTFEYGSKNMSNHIESRTTYTYKDASVHVTKLICNGCDAIRSSADESHQLVSGVCRLCGGNQHVCVYNQQVTSSQYEHTAATCTNKAIYYYSCTCGAKGSATFEFGTSIQSNHWGTIVDGGTSDVHSKYNCCGLVVSRTHEYSSSVYTPATCAVKGVTKYTCACGYSYTLQDIPTIDHVATKNVYSKLDDKQHTVTVICNECGTTVDSYTEDHVPDANGDCKLCNDHTCIFNQEVKTPAYEYIKETCTAPGYYYYSCACGVKGTETFEVDPLGHLPGNSATCTTAQLCLRCNVVINAALGHSFTRFVADSSYFVADATCTEGAKYNVSCNRCYIAGQGTFESGGVDNSNHWGSSIYGGEEFKHTKYSCCGAAISASHSYSLTVQEYATCTTNGTTLYSCICGYKFTKPDIEKLNHSDTRWEYIYIDPTSHYKNLMCNYCDAKLSSTTEGHTFDGNGDCLLCKEHVHVYDQEVETAVYLYESGTCIKKYKYYYSCLCGQKGTTTFDSDRYGDHFGTSVYAGTEDVHTKYSCCGATISTTHGPYTDSELIPSTCKTQGTTKYLCVCKYSYTLQDRALNPANHEGTATYGGEKDLHRCYECCRAVIEGYEGHEFTSKIISNPSCTQVGYRLHTCPCGYEETETLPMTDHVYGNAKYSWNASHSNCTGSAACIYCQKPISETIASSIHNISDATCITFQKTDHVASDWTYNDIFGTVYCQSEHLGSDYDKNNHEGEIVGVGAVNICQKWNCCNLVTDTSHNITTTINSAATCIAKGSATDRCVDCSFKEDKVIEMIDHNFTVVADAKYLYSGATCTSPAYYYISCTMCKGRGSEYYPHGDALGHDIKTNNGPVEATCTTGGLNFHWICDRCGGYFADKAGTTALDYETQVYIEPLGHDIKNTFGPKDPTCTTSGYAYYTICDRCGEYFNDMQGTKLLDWEDDIYMAPLGHNLKLGSAAVAATCTEDGNVFYTECTRCSKCFSDYTAKTELDRENDIKIPATGHSFTNSFGNYDATCTASGAIKYWSCDNCSKCFSDDTGAVELDWEDDIYIPPLGHTASYADSVTWAADCSSVTATAQCTRCNKTFTETVTSDNMSVYEIAPADCVDGKWWSHQADFKQIDIPELCDHEHIEGTGTGHSWTDIEYSWSSDHTTVTGTCYCSVCDTFCIETVSTTTSYKETGTTCGATSKYSHGVTAVSWSKGPFNYSGNCGTQHTTTNPGHTYNTSYICTKCGTPCSHDDIDVAYSKYKSNSHLVTEHCNACNYSKSYTENCVITGDSPSESYCELCGE